MALLSISNKLRLSRTIYKDWWEPAERNLFHYWPGSEGRCNTDHTVTCWTKSLTALGDVLPLCCAEWQRRKRCGLADMLDGVSDDLNRDSPLLKIWMKQHVALSMVAILHKYCPSVKWNSHFKAILSLCFSNNTPNQVDKSVVWLKITAQDC